jgi:hypothetical protein
MSDGFPANALLIVANGLCVSLSVVQQVPGADRRCDVFRVARENFPIRAKLSLIGHRRRSGRDAGRGGGRDAR